VSGIGPMEQAAYPKESWLLEKIDFKYYNMKMNRFYLLTNLWLNSVNFRNFSATSLPFFYIKSNILGRGRCFYSTDDWGCYNSKLELIPNDCKEDFASYLNIILLSLIINNTTYRLEYFMNSKYGNIDFSDYMEMEYGKSLFAMYPDYYKEKRYSDEIWNGFTSYSRVRSDVFNKFLVQDLKIYIDDVCNTLLKTNIYCENDSNLMDYFKGSYIIIKISKINKPSLRANKSNKTKYTHKLVSNNIYGNSKRFYSTSLPQKLVVNSTFDKIVFVDNQSILLLSNMSNDVKFVLINIIKEGCDITYQPKVGGGFFSDLESVLSKLEDGNYSFEFYFYIESSKESFEGFTNDPFNKNSFNKIICSFGYFKATTSKFVLEHGLWMPQFKNIVLTLGIAVDYFENNESKPNLRWDKEVLLVINKITNSSVTDREFKKYKEVFGGKRMYSTNSKSVSNTRKLVVNSTFDNIVFVDNQSILFLSNMLSIKAVIIKISKDGVDKSDEQELSKPFFIEWNTIFSELMVDYYVFSFYFYIESKSPDFLSGVFNFDPFNNKCLIELLGSFGYFKVESIGFRLSENWEFYRSGILMEFSRIISVVEKNGMFNIMWDKRVLLVITKLVDNDENRDLRKDIDSFRCKDTGNTRKFSTYSYNSKKNENTNNQDSVLCKVGYKTDVLDNKEINNNDIGKPLDYIRLITNNDYIRITNRCVIAYGVQKRKIHYSVCRLSNTSDDISPEIRIKTDLNQDNSLAQSFSSSYNAILDIILDSKLTNFEKQKRIEETLMQYWRIELYNLISRKRSVELSNDIGFNIIIRQLESLNEDIIILFNISSFIRNKPYMQIIKDIDPSLILSVVIGKVIPFVIKYNDLESQPITNFIIQIGEEILKVVYLEMYKRDLENEKISSELKFYEYIKQNNLTFNEDESAKLGLDMLNFFSNRSNFVELKEIKVKKDLIKRQLIPKEDFYKLLDGFTLIESEELPMLVPPYPWKIDNNGNIFEFGGNITNNEHRFKDLVSKSHKNYSIKNMKFNKDLIDTVNKMAQTEYTLNKKLLSIITEKEYFTKGNKKLIHFKPHEESLLLSKYAKDKNFFKVNEINVYNSKYHHDTSILNIARLMYNVDKFYITTFIDWRGRIYTSSCSLNMQGNELARGLILMVNGYNLDDKGLIALKIYTANAFGLDKKSKIDRIKWVNKHIDDIINFHNNDLWLSADEPILFLACALELKQYYDNPQFLSRLPVLLDATCNGLQHLSAIANDINLAQRVNISPSTDEEKPNDIYSDLIKPVKEAITELIKDKPEFYNLSKLNITRKLIKRGIMTTTYGVTVKGILEQLLSEHFVKYSLVNNHYLYKPKDIASLGDICLYYKDIYELSRIIYNVLFKSHPTLDNIMNYFNNMVNLMNALELPITWITPHGLKISQSYSKFTKYDITSIMQGKRRKVTLSKIKMDKNNKPYINKVKQINSFIPNFIHSMDASHIVILIKKIISKYNFEIITIHDCFGVHPNHAELLSYLVKESFISIYGDKDCIDKFHSHILNNIKAVFEIVNNQVVDVDGYIHKIPEKPVLGDMDLKLQLLESKYFIN